MTNKQVYDIFANSFSSLWQEKIDRWFPNGKHSIRIWTVNNKEFVFTYNSSDDWNFETVKSFLGRRLT